MNNEIRRTAAVLAGRRTALIAECAHQRAEAANDFNALVAPINPGGLRQYLGRNLKIPLTIAGVVLGMVVTKPARALPILTAGLSLWKVASTVLAIVRRPRAE